MTDFARFDARHYPTLPVREGYEAWAETYEDTVSDLMDRRLLARLATVPWADIVDAADLAFGTGRGGSWLKAQGVRRIDGVDLTPGMLEKARARGVYDRLMLGDLAASGLPGASYDIVTQLLADEHLSDLRRPTGRLRASFAPAGGSCWWAFTRGS